MALVMTTAVLSACIGDLPEAEFPCLVAKDQYNKYNEAYVFSPQGDKKREAMERIREAEKACADKGMAQTDPELRRLAARAQAVTIIRDDFGVPHIYAKTDADAVFGLLYAQAEDDFPRVERNYYWAIGRLAEAEGEAALFSDLRARLYMTTDQAKAAYAAAPAWLQALCDAFADGLNYYLATHPQVTPKVLTRFEPWMPMFFFEGSIGGDIEQIPLDGIRAFYGEGRSIALAALEQARAPRLGYEQHLGSNGFAISGDRTRSGNAMLLINPHTSLYFRGEVHVVSEEGLNAYGAVTWGQFFVYQGFNEHTGWMHTSTGVDFMDEFVEEIVESEDGRLMYRYGEELRPVEVSKVTLRYKDGDAMAERSFPTYRTHHGPITHMLDGKWVATRINWDPVTALEQSYVRSKQDGLEGFNAMMDLRTNSSNNTVYADSSGNIAYYHGNFIPRRDVRFDFSKPVDGSNPATDWLGLHSIDEIVTVTNPANGWLQNCNSTPFTVAGAFSPDPRDYPVYMAPDAENFRGIHAQRVLKDVSDLTLDGLLDLAYDSYLPGFEALIPGLVEAYDAQGDDFPQLAPAIDALRGWDFRTSKESVPMSLAYFYGMQFREDGQNPRGLSKMALINYFGTESPHAERLNVFASALDRLQNDFGDWNIPWGEINRFQRLSGDINLAFDDDKPSLPVGLASGDWGALASYRAVRRDTRRIYGVSGNSFVAVVEFGDKVRAKSILAGGQSGDPGSPHFYDQAQPYVDRNFKDVAFYRKDVDARAVREYHPGEE
ncbi:penicillin amidase family protein [gamma proteobacterium NOR5-3]|nr:penicillin amidase family protein [gamma proteobacterium NOR5-3]